MDVRFGARWRQAGVWDRIMDALAAGHDAAVQMIDTVRVHQHGACIVNRLGEKGAWDIDELKTEFNELIIVGAPIEISGFDVCEANSTR